jgi:hypothetical protein
MLTYDKKSVNISFFYVHTSGLSTTSCFSILSLSIEDIIFKLQLKMLTYEIEEYLLVV